MKTSHRKILDDIDKGGMAWSAARSRMAWVCPTNGTEPRAVRRSTLEAMTRAGLLLESCDGGMLSDTTWRRP